MIDSSSFCLVVRGFFIQSSYPTFWSVVKSKSSPVYAKTAVGRPAAGEHQPYSLLLHHPALTPGQVRLTQSATSRRPNEKPDRLDRRWPDRG